VDVRSRDLFWELIQDEADRGVTVFVTTHFVEEVDYCDWVSFIDAGRLIANATPEALRERYSDGYRVTVDVPPAGRAAAEAALTAAGARVTAENGTLVAAAGTLGPELRATLARLGAHDAAVRVEQPPMTDIFRRMVAEAGAAR
jgi:ABC-2 type transport system ATP-binding protein